MTTPCQNDCEYFSNYTNTCDYTLRMYERRGCPTNACTKYKPRGEDSRRPWGVFRVSTESSKKERAVKPMYDVPEQHDFIETLFVLADCEHEVYEGEFLYELEDGRTLCPECVESMFDELSVAEKAMLLCCESTEIRLPPPVM